MSSEKPSSLLVVDAAKAQASKFRGTKTALGARAKELEAIKAQLDAERDHLEKLETKLKADEAGFAREREEGRVARQAMDKELSSVKADRDRVGAEEKRLQDWARALNDREKSIRDGEEKIKRLEPEFSGQIKEAEMKFQALIEREELVAQRERSLAETIGRLASGEKGAR